MLAVQEWLKANKFDYKLLEDAFGIKATFHPDDSRVILNYCQIDSPKQHPIVRECRGLVLDKTNGNIVARAFTRFFNLGEVPEINNQFVWENSTAQDKEDGSLILSYYYNDDYHINTRGSFGQGEINKSGITWRQLFNLAGGEKIIFDVMYYGLSNLTLVWELCSRYNKVVRDYEKPTLYLLSAFDKHIELPSGNLDLISQALKVNRPQEYKFMSIDVVNDFLTEQATLDPTFEGVVLRDKNNLRLKVKSLKYISLHKLKNNGNIISPKNIIPLILDGEVDEVITYFKELEPTIRSYEVRLNELKTQVENIWHCFHDCVKDKDFAKEALTSPLSSLLFKARKKGGHPFDYLAESQDLIVKVLS